MTSDPDDPIRRRAYAIWEQEGRPQGRHEEHWRRAAEEVARGTGRAGPGGPSDPVLPRDVDRTPGTGRSRRGDADSVAAVATVPEAGLATAGSRGVPGAAGSGRGDDWRNLGRRRRRGAGTAQAAGKGPG